MSSLSHRAAELLLVELSAGRATQAERMQLELHLQECERCASRHGRVDALISALREADREASTTFDESADRRLVMQAMMQAGAERGSQRGDPSARRYAWTFAAACAVAASVWMLWPAAVERGPGSAPVAQRDRVLEAHEAPRPEPPVASAASCPGVQLEPSAGVELRVAVSRPDVCRLLLSSGTLLVHVDPEAHLRVSIDTPNAGVRVVGTVFLVAVAEGRTQVAVYRGEVEVETRRGRMRALHGDEIEVTGGEPELQMRAARREDLRSLADFVGEAPSTEPRQASARDPMPATPHRPAAARPRGRRDSGVERAPDPSLTDLRQMLRAGQTAEAREQAQRGAEGSRQRPELLTIIAESHALEGQYERALAAYGYVWEAGQSTTAANALLAAAAIALDRLRRPAEAQRLYERYLREYPEGSLSGVARVGRCRALGRAGQREAARSCALDYLRQHPRGRFRRQAESIARGAEAQ
jgi:hypothetical protein